MKIYGLKNCDTCKKAMKALGDNASFHDVRANGVTKTQIAKWAKAVGWEKLLNTRSTTWRGLGEKEKADINQTKAITLMLEHPTLIKRPVIENGSDVHCGWAKDTQAAVLS